MNPSSNRREEWDAWAPDYGRDVDWLEEILDPDLRELLAPAGKRVLDAGCGTGRRAASVLGDASAVLAVDFSEGMAAVARDVFSAMGGAEVLLLDMEKEPLPPGRPFDAAMAVSVMHHIADPAAVLGKIKASLVPGGRLVLVDFVSGRPKAEALKYYLEMACRHAPWRLVAAFLKRSFCKTRLSAHQARENHLTLDAFERRYADLLPGGRVEVRHGIFAYFVWDKPAVL